MIPIKLIVRTPNQKIKDHPVEGYANWTIHKLKEHLSNMHPIQPKPCDQKLIYSGRLLQDDLQLKEIFPPETSNHLQTIHLVCVSNTNTKRNSESPTADSVEPPPTELHHRTTTRPAETDFDHPASINHSQSVPDVQQIWQQHQQWFEMHQHQQGEGSANYEQQWYNYQMMIYQQQMQAAAMYHGQMPQHQYSEPNLEVHQEVRQVELEPPQAVQPMDAQNNGQGGVGAAFFDDEEDDPEMGGRPRDWLDWLYTFCRFGVLFSIVYFYSSFRRFALVVALFLFFYIFQSGLFWPFGGRRQRERNAIERIEEENRRAQQQADQGDPQVPDRVEGGDVPEEPATDTDEIEDDADAADDEEEEVGDEEPEMSFDEPQPVGRAQVAWTFLSTFFTSLVPEQPPPMENMF